MTALDTAPAAEPTFEDLAARVDRAVAALEQLDEGSRSAALELKSAIEAFHRPALVHLVRALRDEPAAAHLLMAAMDEPVVRAVFALQGIIRTPPAMRAEQALDAVRPYLRSHGGDVELVAVEGSTAIVRLHGTCHGCSQSAETLRHGVEEALVSAVEEIDRVEVAGDTPTLAFIPLGSVGRKPGTGPSPERGWRRGPAVADIGQGAAVRFDLAADSDSDSDDDSDDDGERVDSFVVSNVDQRLAVFRNACAHQGRSLDGGRLEDGVLTCPWHGFRYDATTGECLSAPGVQLQPVPTLIDDGHLWIRPDGR